MDKLLYNTRDKDGKNIAKEVFIKKYTKEAIDFICMCGKKCSEGTPIKKIVSSNFTEWAYVSDYVCESCSNLFSLYFYNYIIDESGVRLLNIREMAKEVQIKQKSPFKIVITTSQKKHLFYKATTNYDPNDFIVSIDDEQISCQLKKIQEQFLYVGSLQTLGESKERLKRGEIKYEILKKVGHRAILYLREQLKTRQIQIPLYLSQKLEISEEEALCNLDLILNQ